MAASSEAFLSIAVREGFVPPDAATQFAQSDAGMLTSAGVMTAAQRDIVESLLHPNEIVPGYELLSHLGHGGMGVVYRARQLAFDRVIALKTVLLGAQASQAALSRFEQEARSLGRLVHPHLVTAYDFGRHHGRLYLAMEFVDGENAADWLARHVEVSEATAWGIIRQTAAGLAYAATAGVIHRDIKPANLLLTKPPAGFPLPKGLPLVKVADFGLALLAEDVDNRTRLTSDNATVGSPQYMAPEQLSGSRVDHRADIYALGATAYQFLTDRAPFEGLSVMQVFAQKLNADPPPASEFRDDLSPGSQVLLRDLMHRNPDQRLTDYDTVLQRIDAVLADLSGQTPVGMSAATAVIPKPEVTERLSRPIPPWPARRWWLPVVAILGVLMLVQTASYLEFYRKTSALPGPRAWQPTEWAVPCYNGRSLQGWRVVSGNWIPGQDDGEGGRTLTGANGAIGYPLLRPEGNSRRPLVGYQIIAVANVHTADAAELQFGLVTAKDLSATPRYVIRLLKDRVQLGPRSVDHGPLSKIVAERAIEADGDHELRLERHERDWFIVIDDVLLGSIPLSNDLLRPEFLLAAEGHGLVRFSDIILEELAPTSP